MNEREELIQKLQHLMEASDAKQRKCQEESGCGSGVGFITREALEIARLLPRMQSLGVTLDDCQQGPLAQSG